MKPIGEIALEYYRSGHDKTQRFGQYFVNYYVKNIHLPWPELFYETDNAKALEIAILYCERENSTLA